VISVANAVAIDEKRFEIAAKLLKYKSFIAEEQLLKSRYPDMISATDNLEQLKRVYANDLERERLSAKLSTPIPAPRQDIDELVTRLKQNQHIVTTRALKTNELIVAENRLKSIRLLDDPIVESNRLNDMKLSKQLIDSIDIKARIDACTKKQQLLERSVGRAVRLMNIIKTAELDALSEIVQLINLRASVYIDRFFTQSNVCANIVFDGKIDIEITVDAIESDTSSMSGGEFARVALAFDIAIAEINDAEILLIDESTASLDVDSTEHVISAISENFNGSIFMIAHQITKGSFDSVINV
jgi:DNA repair exonuclease SbcCD ATPase subunit